MLTRIAITALLFSLSLSPLPVSARADSPPHQQFVTNGMSLDAAVRQVKQQTGGRILSAETVSRNGDRIHRIKVLLPDGTVRVMTFNAG